MFPKNINMFPYMNVQLIFLFFKLEHASIVYYPLQQITACLKRERREGK